MDADLLLGWVQQTSLSTMVRQSDWAVMALEAVHLIGLALLGGAAVIVALGAVRRNGLRGLSLTVLARGLRPLMGVGLLLMAASGSLIAISMPFKYYANTAFRWKMLLLLFAIVGTVALVWMSGDRGRRDNSGRRGGGTTESEQRVLQRVLALVALLLWLAVGFSGRLIGFL
jgi:hypothetical protein